MSVEMLREAAVSTDPVGAIFAAINRYDRTLSRAVIEIARLRGVPESVIRLEYDLPP